MWFLLRIQYSHFFQSSRYKWYKEGVTNSSYFHASIQNEGKQIVTIDLNVDEGQIQRISKIRQEVVRNFCEIFRERSVAIPRLNGVVFCSLSKEKNIVLTAPFSLYELECEMSLCDGNKSLGRDDFNFSFFKRLWNLFRDDMGIMFDQFLYFSSLPHSFASYFMTLTFKFKSPSHLGEFRLIYLVGSLYEVVAKLLATRIGMVIKKLIFLTNQLFLKVGCWLTGWWWLTT